MNIIDNFESVEDVSQAGVYITMGLSLLLPITMYVFIRSVFCVSTGGIGKTEKRSHHLCGCKYVRDCGGY